VWKLVGVRVEIRSSVVVCVEISSTMFVCVKIRFVHWITS